jgi:hypothetical protein
MLISHGHQPPLASQSRADDMLEGPESLSENEVAAVFDEIEQRIAESPGSAIDPKLGGHEILAGRIYDFAELEQVDKGIVSGALEDDVQQVGLSPRMACLIGMFFSVDFGRTREFCQVLPGVAIAVLPAIGQN